MNSIEMQDKKRTRNDKRKDIVEAKAKTEIESLPREIILYILSKASISSLLQLKYVSTKWYSFSRDPYFINLCKDRSDEINQCLIFQPVYPTKNKLSVAELDAADNVKDTQVMKFCSPFPASMPKFGAICSCNGLVCLSDHFGYGLHIYNPFTMEYRELPEHVHVSTDHSDVLGFGFHPTTMEYKVVKIMYSGNHTGGNQRHYLRYQGFWHPEVLVFSLKSCLWKNLGRISHYLEKKSVQVLVHGRLHWLTLPNRFNRNRKLVSFDLADEQFRTVPKPDALSLGNWDYAVSLKGFLSVVSSGDMDMNGRLEIWVMKEYDVKESWVKQFNIASYVPKVLELEAKLPRLKRAADGPSPALNIAIKGNYDRVLCALRNGEILLEYRGRALVIYDPRTESFKDVGFKGMPRWFHTIVHVGNFNQIDTILGM